MEVSRSGIGIWMVGRKKFQIGERRSRRKDKEIWIKKSRKKESDSTEGLSCMEKARTERKSKWLKNLTTVE